MDKNLVTIMTFSDFFEAKLCQGQLEAEGIDCFLKNAEVLAAMPYLSVGQGGYQLQVDVKDQKRAAEIVKSA